MGVVQGGWVVWQCCVLAALRKERGDKEGRRWGRQEFSLIFVLNHIAETRKLRWEPS